MTVQAGTLNQFLLVIQRVLCMVLQLVISMRTECLTSLLPAQRLRTFCTLAISNQKITNESSKRHVIIPFHLILLCGGFLYLNADEGVSARYALICRLLLVPAKS